MKGKGHKLSRRQLLTGTAAASLAVTSTRVLGVEPIKIGFGMSLTGPNAGAGKPFLLAREVWRDEINANGGLLGRQVQLIHYDDQSNPALVPGIYAKLIDVDKADILLSAFGTNQIAPAMPLVMQKKMVYLGLFGTGVNDEFKYDRYFQILPNGPEGNRSLSLGFFETAMTMDPKPTTVAIAGEDSEFGQNILKGARQNIAKTGLKVVYDRNFPPATADHGPIVRAIQATNPDIVFVASYPGASAGMLRAVIEIGYTPRMFGGAMIGLQLTPFKAQFGPTLNGLVINENFVPEPTMKFPGVEDYLKRYQARAPGAGADPLGFWSPFAYAQLQTLAETLRSVGAIDQAKIAEYMHKARFSMIVGEVKFGPDGEWEKSRIPYIQYRNIQGKDINQFREPGKAVIVYPAELKSGELIHPYSKARGS